jgi:hypothetical protein
MAYRNGNYSAFYVSEQGSESNLEASATKDFVYYNLLRAWGKKDNDFPFNDSHNKNYNVRDGSDWEKTLKPRIHERLNNSKNIILFLSSITKSSRALREEIFFGVGKNKLPVIVVYPEYKNKNDISSCGSKSINKKIKNLWNNLPVFRDSMNEVPTIHIPMKKDLIKKALEDEGFMFSTKKEVGIYFYSC